MPSHLKNSFVQRLPRLLRKLNPGRSWLRNGMSRSAVWKMNCFRLLNIMKL
ncbi:hypothetical protein D3C85_1574680 [compost metagenome]